MAELELFSPSARTALQFARAAAERMNHPSIGTEHLLLGVVEEREDLAGYLLGLLGVRLKDVTRAIERMVDRSDGPLLQSLDLTAHARLALETAIQERRRLGHDQIQTVHLLLGILGMPTSAAAGIFKQLAVDVDELRSSLYSMYASDGDRRPIGPVLERIRDERRAHDDLERDQAYANLSEDDVGGRARTILRFARNIAHSLGHETVGTDHLLLGFVADRDCEAARALSGLGLSEKRLTLAVRFARGVSNQPQSDIVRPIPLSPRTWNAIELALISARRRHARAKVAGQVRYKWWPHEPCPVDSADLLLGVIEAGTGTAVTILTSFGLDLALVRQRVLALCGSTFGSVRRDGPAPGTFWEWLSQQLIWRQWSLADLAREARVDRRRLRAWVRGDQRPSAASCDVLAAACMADPNLVRRLAGRPLKPAAVAKILPPEPPADRTEAVEAMRILFERVRWDEGRINRMTTLLRLMAENDEDAADSPR
jgi:ATP-dependent Clp protease ATP-binding subunit ClpA